MNVNSPSSMTQILTAGVQEVMGEHDLRALFDQNPGVEQFSNLGDLQTALEGTFGANSGRGVLLRTGRASFRHMLPGFWHRLGMTNLKFRLNPMPVRIRLGLKALAAMLTEYYGEQVHFEETLTTWVWRMPTCPFCAHRRTSGPVCDFAVGILQEFLSWTSSGRFYLVEEVECIGAGGSACVFQVLKKPLD